MQLAFDFCLMLEHAKYKFAYVNTLKDVATSHMQCSVHLQLNTYGWFLNARLKKKQITAQAMRITASTVITAYSAITWSTLG